MSVELLRSLEIVDLGGMKRPQSDNVDLDLVLLAQQHAQMAFSFLQQAQGYSGDATLGELGEAWVDACWPRLSKSTIASYTDSVRALAKALGRLRIGDGQSSDLVAAGRLVRLDDLEVGEVEQAIDEIAAGRWNCVTCALRRLMTWGNRHGFPGVVTLRPELRRHRAAPVWHPPKTWARATHLLHEAWSLAGPRSRPTAGASLCAVLWGVRRGAVARIEWSNVDLAAGQLVVADKGRARVVVLGELGGEVLLSLDRRGPFVFYGRDDDDRHVHANSLTTHTRRVLRRAGLELTLHQAGRHAAGCAIVGQGGTTSDAAAHLGHVNTRVTEERYLPPLKDTTRARQLLDQAFEKLGGGR